MRFPRRRSGSISARPLLWGALARPAAGCRVEVLESRRLLAADVWSGAGANANFTNPLNWVGGVAPIAGQAIDFPAGATSSAVTVDAAVTVGNVEFDAAYTVSSANAITLDGTLTATAGATVISNPIILGQTTAVNIFDVATLTLNRISDGGMAFGLTKEGNGVLTLEGASDTYTGATALNAGTLVDLTTLASSVTAAAGTTLDGNGTVNSLTATGATVALVDGALPGTLTSTSGLTFTSGSLDSVNYEFSSSATSQIVVNGGLISLGGATLNITPLTGFLASSSDVITLISNNTNNPITGTFKNLPQGSTVTVGGVVYTISYTGGASDEDVTLTAASASTTLTVTTSHVPVFEGHTLYITATLGANDTNDDPFNGTVTFYDNFVALGAVTVINGTATAYDGNTNNTNNFGGNGNNGNNGGNGTTAVLPEISSVAAPHTSVTVNFNNLPAGTNTVTASYTGDLQYADVTSAPVVFAVRTGTQPVILDSTTTASTRGYTVEETVDATDTAPQGISGLSYYWSAIRRPSGAPKPVYSSNNSNLASDIIVRFGKAGGYVLECKVQNLAGNYVTVQSYVNVVQTPTTLKIVPHNAQVHIKKSQQYTATVVDQFNHPMRTPQSLSYEVIVGTASGSISQSGLFSATAIAGAVTIEVDDGDKLSATVGANVV